MEDCHVELLEKNKLINFLLLSIGKEISIGPRTYNNTNTVPCRNSPFAFMRYEYKPAGTGCC
jgi:hypothetical protein